MQNNSTAPLRRRPRLLVVELWGLGDLALAVPFLRAATQHANVTLLAKPHAAPILRRFCPEVRLEALTAPWTSFNGKYQLIQWPWAELTGALANLRRERFDAAVSARRDPRDHALLALSGAQLRAGFPRLGSRALLTDLVKSNTPHRAAHWAALAEFFGWDLVPLGKQSARSRRIVIHTGAAQAVREWPRERFEALARELTAQGWNVELIDNSLRDLDALLDHLASADFFIGNDSGPGHLAALSGVPTFTIFGPQLPELFAPTHPASRWIEGAPCAFKPCFDSCRFGSPHCIREIGVEAVTSALTSWLSR